MEQVDEIVKVGQEVEVIVKSIDREKKRIALTMRSGDRTAPRGGADRADAASPSGGASSAPGDAPRRSRSSSASASSSSGSGGDGLGGDAAAADDGSAPVRRGKVATRGKSDRAPS